MSSCVFCKILNDELEASFVYRGESVTAFMDLGAINPGHVLIVPNKHSERFVDIDSKVTGDMFKEAQIILKAIQKSDIACEGANIFLSDGEVAGQEVPHSHLHIAPRFKGDAHRMGFSHFDGSLSDRKNLDEAAKEISKNLEIG
jgi:histidine triad (HIT) family protein